MEQREGSPAKKPCIDGVGNRSSVMKLPHARKLYFKFSLKGKTSQEPECQPSNAIKKILDEEKIFVPTYICAALDFFHFTFHLYLEVSKAINLTSTVRFDYLGLGSFIHVEKDHTYEVKGALLQQIKGGKLPCDIYPPVEASLVSNEIQQEEDFAKDNPIWMDRLKNVKLTKQQLIWMTVRVFDVYSLLSIIFSTDTHLIFQGNGWYRTRENPLRYDEYQRSVEVLHQRELGKVQQGVIDSSRTQCVYR